jgi:hydrogenase maturation protein HypF
MTPAAAAERVRLRILVRGAVQGVGFRPFVHRQATALGLAGWVGNSGDGVTVEAEGDRPALAALLPRLGAPPPPARVAAIESAEIAPRGEAGFAIRPSETAGAAGAEMLPDLAPCADCLAELFDPADRRYRYPFIACARCGPRYSVIAALPYDRVRTAMRPFRLCPRCQAEYDDPADRRFHAEATACPACGPRLALRDGAGRTLAEAEEALLAAAAALRAGRIVAVKGVGGFHLMVDARDAAALARLRARKRRPEKPFAVMFPSLAEVARGCRLLPAEEQLLADPARPIVLLRRAGDALAAGVAPGIPWLGALLPYAPLHHLLLRELGFPVVATSGNLSGEPLVTDEPQALDRLAGIADLFLVHDRAILRPVDDSVARLVCGRPLLLRRARGYAPAPIACTGLRPGILALGGHLKATVALTRADGVALSQHLGDLAGAPARALHRRALAELVDLHRGEVRRVAADLHPDFASAAAAEALGLPLTGVQHHVAHVVSCMAENGIAPPALGVAWDGAGYGPDGTIWGGEFLRVTPAGWRRVAWLRPFRLPGGEAAMREPRRSALGLLFAALGEDAFARTHLPPLAAFSPAERAVVAGMLARGVNAPWTSSAGRLFDAVASLAGLGQRASYEGQAALALEGAADGETAAQPYPFALGGDAAGLVLDWQPALEALLADLAAGAGPGAVAAAFHDGLARAVAAVAARLGDARVVLCGGCFQNARLTAAAVAALRAIGAEPFWHRRVPPNDGGLALGQAVWASWQEERGGMPCA